MKRLLLVLILTLPALLHAQTAPDPMTQAAVAAFQKEDYATARMLFEGILSERPQDPVALRYLRIISVKQKNAAGSAETVLKSVIIPKVDFQDTSAREAMTFVSQQVASLTKGSHALNVVWLLPAEQNPRVTLSLGNVPASEVMRYIADAAGLQLTYEAYAVKVTALAK